MNIKEFKAWMGGVSAALGSNPPNLGAWKQVLEAVERLKENEGSTTVEPTTVESPVITPIREVKLGPRSNPIIESDIPDIEAALEKAFGKSTMKLEKVDIKGSRPIYSAQLGPDDDIDDVMSSVIQALDEVFDKKDKKKLH